jgi:drug/metabolite transporter (DMT)-like permease
MLSSGVAAGIFWMCMATLLSSVTGAMVRQLGGEIHAFELVFFRSVGAVVILAPWMLRRGVRTLGTRRMPLYGLRVFFAYTAMVMLFYALGEMPIADVYALQYTIPLFTILLAVLILKQPTDRHGWAACFIGFAGALIVMRPGIIELTLAAICALASAFMSAGSNTTIKLLSRTESPEIITVYTNLLMIPLAFVPMLFFWATPSWEQAPWIVGVAVFGSVGGYCFTRSVSAADARVVQPFQFTRMIFATGLGFLMFGEFPDIWTWVGAAVIFVSSYYIVIREKAAKRAAATAPVRETAS